MSTLGGEACCHCALLVPPARMVCTPFIHTRVGAKTARKRVNLFIVRAKAPRFGLHDPQLPARTLD
jgi:hypothetical protein